MLSIQTNALAIIIFILVVLNFINCRTYLYVFFFFILLFSD